MQIQKFGFEIRRTGNLSNLYKDVDTILQNVGITQDGISAAAQAATVAHSLQKMMKVDSHFSVCTIRTCAELCQVINI